MRKLRIELQMPTRMPLRVMLLMEVPLGGTGDPRDMRLEEVYAADGVAEALVPQGALIRSIDIATLDARNVEYAIISPAKERLAEASSIIVSIEPPEPLQGGASTTRLVRGYVADDAGRPVGGADLRVVDLASLRHSQTDELGHAEIAVPLGRVEIEVSLLDDSASVYLSAEEQNFSAVLHNVEPDPDYLNQPTPRAPAQETYLTSGAFSQDLGGAPTPLFTPDRSVDESSTLVVVRLDEPSLRVKYSALPEVVEPERIADGSNDVSQQKAGRFSNIFASMIEQVNRSIASEQRESARRVTSLPIKEAIPPALQKLVRRRSAVDSEDTFRLIADTLGVGKRTRITPATPIKWFDVEGGHEAGTVARGHILRFVQRWQADGYSLGRVLHSLPLAPGQYKSVAIVDWRREDKGSSEGSVLATESLAAEMTRSRHLTEDVSSVLEERMKGSSSSWSFGAGLGGGSGATGTQGGMGVSSMGGAMVGVGYASANAEQENHRDLTASLQQGIRDATAQAASSVRDQRTTVVKTLTQAERAEAVTEVVANNNRNHAMTILYFEVLRHLLVATEVAHVSPCLFVPLPTVPFTAELAALHRPALEPLIVDPSLRGGFDALERLFTDEETPDDELVALSVSFEVLTGKRMSPNPVDGEGEKESSDEMPVPYGAVELGLRGDGGGRSVLDASIVVEQTAGSVWHYSVTSADGRGWILSSIRSVELRLKEPGWPGEGTDRVRDIEIVGTSRARSIPLASVSGWAPLRQGRISLTTSAADLSGHGVKDGRSATRLLAYLNAHRLFFHKAIWSSLDRDELFAMLDQRLAPSIGNWQPSIASVVRPEPVTFVGNSLVLPVIDGVRFGPGDPSSGELLERYRIAKTEQRVTLPTGGVFAEAVLGASEAAEVIDDSRFWRWDEHPLEKPAEIAPLSTDTRHQATGLEATPLSASLVGMQTPMSMPDPTGMSAGLTAISQANIFRDLTAVEKVTQNSIDALRQAVQSAQALGEKAGENATTAFTKYTDAQTARYQADATQRDMATLEQARRSGLVSAPEAERIAKGILTRNTAQGGSGSAAGAPGSAQESQGAGGASAAGGGGGAQPAPGSTSPDVSAAPGTGTTPGAAGGSQPATAVRRSTHRARRQVSPASTDSREARIALRQDVVLILRLMEVAGGRARGVGDIRVRMTFAIGNPSGVVFVHQANWAPQFAGHYRNILQAGVQLDHAISEMSGRHICETTVQFQLKTHEYTTEVATGGGAQISLGPSNQVNGTQSITRSSIQQPQATATARLTAFHSGGPLTIQTSDSDELELGLTTDMFSPASGHVDLAVRNALPQSAWVVRSQLTPTYGPVIV